MSPRLLCTMHAVLVRRVESFGYGASVSMDGSIPALYFSEPPSIDSRQLSDQRRIICREIQDGIGQITSLHILILASTWYIGLQQLTRVGGKLHY